ncbi:hypothetical protein BD779DRAFT_1533775 [Infundibulicybe gibba]|nr:hypothetical protein BD779DRAFT_1533775 [Infundibulicybe gibba]
MSKLGIRIICTLCCGCCVAMVQDERAGWLQNQDTMCSKRPSRLKTVYSFPPWDPRRLWGIQGEDMTGKPFHSGFYRALYVFGHRGTDRLDLVPESWYLPQARQIGSRGLSIRKPLVLHKTK